jgi:predicted nucleic acid-binding protein
VRDPKDVMILACAVGGKADFIVSGAKDLLTLVSYEGIPILTAEQFLKRVANP